MTDILALDLSKSGTGWARFVTGEARPTYGSLKLGNEMNDIADCQVRLYKFLCEQFLFAVPDEIWVEAPLPGNQQSNEQNNRLANALCATVHFTARAKRIRCLEVGNGTWKSTQLTNRRLPRTEIKALSIAMAEKFGMAPKNDNEADALHILTHALQRNCITPPWLPQQMLPEIGG